jgi:hypothetical protein
MIGKGFHDLQSREVRLAKALRPESFVIMPKVTARSFTLANTIVAGVSDKESGDG